MHPVRIHARRIFGWTLTLTISPSAFASLTLDRPHTPDPWPRPEPAFDLTVRWDLEDLDASYLPLRRTPRPLLARLRTRWTRPRPHAPGPWTLDVYRTGLTVERHSEHDCPTHTLFSIYDEDGGCPAHEAEPLIPTPCTCPRFLGYLSVRISRPERRPTITMEEPPF
ncbi:hypothetical protein BOQ63_000460 (plasmid) [Streptomyces viridifaciens]|nr:hypothetical protein BOQ63_000460 [Streptomyces viridifaciens]